MKSMNIRSVVWYCPPDDIVKPAVAARTCAKNASTSAGSHSHGYWPVNTANRRTSDSRGLIVHPYFRNRVCCCRVQPSSIASNTARGRSRGTTPPGKKTSAAPGRPTTPAPSMTLHPTQH